MPEIALRKMITSTEEIFHEGGPVAPTSLRRAAVLAIIENPFAGRYEPDIQWFMEDLKPLGLDMAGKLIQVLGGASPDAVQPIDAILGKPLPENDEREEYMRAICETGEDGSLLVYPFDIQDSSMLANLVRANCLMIRPKHAPPASAGDHCKIVRL